MSEAVEKPAQGVAGHLLYYHEGAGQDRFIFRVYEKNNAPKHRDYRLIADDIKVQITDDRLSLYENENAPWGGTLGWATAYTQRSKSTKQLIEILEKVKELTPEDKVKLENELKAYRDQITLEVR